MRYRYTEKFKFLNKQFDPKEVYFMSTNTERSLMSGASFLHGFYPPLKCEQSTKQILESFPPFEIEFGDV